MLKELRATAHPTPVLHRAPSVTRSAAPGRPSPKRATSRSSSDLLERARAAPIHAHSLEDETFDPSPGRGALRAGRPLARAPLHRPQSEGGEEVSAPGELEDLGEDAAAIVNYWWSVQGPTEARVAPEKTGGLSTDFGPGSISASDIRIAKGGGASTETSLSVDRTGVSAGLENRSSARTLSLEGYAAPGWVEVDTSGLWNLAAGRLWGAPDAGTIGGASSLAGWTDFVGGSLEVDLGLTTTLSACAGMFSSISGRREARYLGPYRGTCAELRGEHAVEIEDAREAWHSLFAGLNQGGLGLGLTGNRQSSRSVVFRTHVDLDAARDIAADDPGALEKAARNLRRALGLRVDGLSPPDIMRPLETMRVHDEVRLVVERETQGIFLVGSGLSKVGVVGTARGRVELAVRRLPSSCEGESSSLVEVSVRRVEVRQLGFVGSVAPGLGADGTLNLSLARRETFVFDLREPAARGAFDRALAGDAPVALERMTKSIGAAEELLALFDARELQPGVRRTFLERIELRGTAAYAGTKVFFLMVGSDYAGLSRACSSHRERLIATDGEVVLYRKTHAARSRKELLIFGQTERRIFASHRRLLAFERGEPRWQFAGIAVRAVLSDSRVSKNGQNVGMVDVLNDLFGTNLSRFERPGRGQSREVFLERLFTESDLAAVGQADQGRLVSAWRHTRIPGRKLRTLVRELSGASADLAAERLARFVSRHGIEGFAALHHLLDGAPGKLTLHTTSSAYSKPLEDARELRGLFGGVGSAASEVRAPYGAGAAGSAASDVRAPYGAGAAGSAASDVRAPCGAGAALVRASIILRALEDGILDLADDPLVAWGPCEAGPVREHPEPLLSALRLARSDVEDLVGEVTAHEIAGMETAALEAVTRALEPLIAARESSDDPFPAPASRVVATARTELSQRRARSRAAFVRRLEEAGIL